MRDYAETKDSVQWLDLKIFLLYLQVKDINQSVLPDDRRTLFVLEQKVMSGQARFRFKWWGLLGVSLLAFTAFLDATIVNTALPFIQTA